MANKKVAKAGKAAQKARSNPYLAKLIEDEDLRKNIFAAYENARDAVGRLSNGKHPSRQIFADKKLHKKMKATAENIRDAGQALQAPRKRKSGFGRIVLVGLVGTGVALALSEGLRKKVLDTLFGAEEEFEYTSTTAPTPTASPPAGSPTT